MIARARAVAHGSAYTTYATLKRDAEFVCCENMSGDMTAAVTDDDLDNIWMQFKYAGENYIAKGKAVSRNLIAMEVSPAKEESWVGRRSNGTGSPIGLLRKWIGLSSEIRMERCRRNGWTWRIANGLPCCTMMPRVGFHIYISWCRALPSMAGSMTQIL